MTIANRVLQYDRLDRACIEVDPGRLSAAAAAGYIAHVTRCAYACTPLVARCPEGRRLATGGRSVLAPDMAKPDTRITRHYDVEIIPAFDLEGDGRFTITGRGGLKLIVGFKGTDTPEAIGAKIGAALLVLEVGVARTAESDVVLPNPCGGC